MEAALPLHPLNSYFCRAHGQSSYNKIEEAGSGLPASKSGKKLVGCWSGFTVGAPDRTGRFQLFFQLFEAIQLYEWFRTNQHNSVQIGFPGPRGLLRQPQVALE